MSDNTPREGKEGLYLQRSRKRLEAILKEVEEKRQRNVGMKAYLEETLYDSPEIGEVEQQAKDALQESNRLEDEYNDMHKRLTRDIPSRT